MVGSFVLCKVATCQHDPGMSLPLRWRHLHSATPAEVQIRKQLALEFTSDLTGVAEENASLLRESLSSSLEKMFAAPVTIASDDEGGEQLHPDMEN